MYEKHPLRNLIIQNGEIVAEKRREEMRTEIIKELTKETTKEIIECL